VWLNGASQEAQPTAQQRSSLVVIPLEGKELFAFYCASCHGRDGKGDGPVSRALKAPAPDLTTISQRNKATFPRQRLIAIVNGTEKTETPVHGSQEMPVWGPIFRAIDAHDRLNGVRVANLVDYLESIQQK
jgi:mono/diheme cytochrome c family protein